MKQDGAGASQIQPKTEENGGAREDEKVTQRQVIICRGTGCVSSESEQIQAALDHEIEWLELGHSVLIKPTGCHGFCQRGPIVIIEPEGIFYTKVTVDDAAEIVRSHIKEGKIVERLLYHDPVTSQPIPHYQDIGFYKNQQRVILRNCGHINPENIQHYLVAGGYQALKKALFEMTPEALIEEVKRAGLRGRGGAGFPTGMKWEYCYSASGAEKYVVCNADEGDPGAFMDRSILEADPHSVLEGLIIAAYAVGAKKGFIYVREEYPLAIRRVITAIRQAERCGLLGDHIIDSDFSFRVQVKHGAGAFVCGEETSLMSSIEGKRPAPRPRPPFPAQAGIWGKPTCINNVKTLASVPQIILKGSKWFSSIGTEDSKGTAVFALTGKVANSGLIEVPMGTTLRHIIFDIGGGISTGKRFKAVQTGGPSGGCLPESFLDTPVDYSTLAKAGSIMGSGGMVVADEDTCMVEMARFFLSFTQAESCGKCVPCRVGTRQMLNILENITSGKGKPSDIEKLLQLAETVRLGSLCGLGQTAPNPVLTTIRYFRDEYEIHINEKRCPAFECRQLLWYRINPERCQGCGICKRACPTQAISGEKREVHVIDQNMCIKCGSCFQVCPERFQAVEMGSGDVVAPTTRPDKGEPIVVGE